MIQYLINAACFFTMAVFVYCYHRKENKTLHWSVALMGLLNVAWFFITLDEARPK